MGHNKSLKYLGAEGESLIAKYLTKLGFTILQKNFSCKYGEIDIIAKNHDLLSFIEVKLRSAPKFPISEVILPTKQRKIINTALYFIASNNLKNLIYRFDVALIEKESNNYNIKFIENAFTQDI
jgi:putative endonuclease